MYGKPSSSSLCKDHCACLSLKHRWYWKEWGILKQSTWYYFCLPCSCCCWHGQGLCHIRHPASGPSTCRIRCTFDLSCISVEHTGQGSGCCPGFIVERSSHSTDPPGACPELLSWDPIAVIWWFLQLQVCISLWEISLEGEGLEIILVYLSLEIQWLKKWKKFKITKQLLCT